MEVVALRTKHDGAVGGDGVELFFSDGGDDDGAADVMLMPPGASVMLFSVRLAGPSVFHETMTPVSVGSSANFRPVLASQSLVTAKPMG